MGYIFSYAASEMHKRSGVCVCIKICTKIKIIVMMTKGVKRSSYVKNRSWINVLYF